MKTLSNKIKSIITILVLTIIVHAQGLTVRLTGSDIAYLNRSGAPIVKRTLSNYQTGGTIRNNAAADLIIKSLKERK